MTQQDIKDLEKELWNAADELNGCTKLMAQEYNYEDLRLRTVNVYQHFSSNLQLVAKVFTRGERELNPSNTKNG
tara:strand:- start:14288 stop:14509 length:222 start_codon:yes stop_codon:yes gene_type:complete